MEHRSSLLDDIDEIVRSAVGAILDSSLYSSKKVKDWIHTILDACLRDLVALNRPSKYLLSCVLIQKNGTGFRTVVSQYWDGRSDFTRALHWENDHIHCLVTIHAIALHLTEDVSSGNGAGATGAGAMSSQAPSVQSQYMPSTDHLHKKKTGVDVFVQPVATGEGGSE